jgi:beta-D-xylosidase 4
MPPLSVAVTNTGDHTSDFVALVFIKSEAGPKPYPLKTLAAYDRLRDIQPGSTARAKLSWTLDNIARRNQDGDLVLYPGTYTLMLDEPTQAVVNITLTGTEAVLDKWPKP